MAKISYSITKRPTATEYIEFLKTSDLGRMYPRKRFRQRIEKLLRSAGVIVTANDGRRLVGVCLGVTDNAYFLFVTDLGVSRGYERRGIGRTLLRRAQRAAGGRDELVVVSWSNTSALPFYAACGLVRQSGLVGREAEDWDLFDVHELKRRD
jgi:ribosomal protein S18 acetylase RimI-like enzyme